MFNHLEDVSSALIHAHPKLHLPEDNAVLSNTHNTYAHAAIRLLITNYKGTMEDSMSYFPSRNTVI